MTLKNQNPWKLLSIGLLGVITIGLLTPVDAKPPSGDSENQFEIIFVTLDSLQSQIDDVVGDFATHVTEDGDLSDTNEIELLINGGSTSCEDITGDSSLCDGDDANTTYSGSDFATSDQSCSAGKVVTGVDANGAVTCATNNDGDSSSTNEIQTFEFVTEKYTETNVPNSGHLTYVYLECDFDDTKVTNYFVRFDGNAGRIADVQRDVDGGILLAFQPLDGLGTYAEIWYSCMYVTP